jgi:hypothetical protein
VRTGARRPARLLFPKSGVKITEVLPGTAARQGLKTGDTILSFDGKPTPTFDDLRSAVQAAGKEAEMVYVNGDTSEQESVTVFPENGRIGIAGQDASLEDSPGADEPAEDMTGDDVADTAWQGSEDLAGFGRLTFQLRDDGTAIIIDARSRVLGSWSQDGADVTALRTAPIRAASKAACSPAQPSI